MAFIDPVKKNLTGNTNYENLNIYVDLTAQRRAGTTINADTSEARSVASAQFNLMGYKVNKDIANNPSKLFTTEYSEIYNNETEVTGLYEGFGITNISIEVNSSYVPTVKIDFVDIKGMAFFNNKEASPYSVLFDFPPPIFTLTVKGYYGYALEYKLHMLRHNTRFEAETGNYYINAEFVGNTFAPLADILYQYVLNSSTMEGEQNNIDPKEEPRNLKELVKRSKTIKSEIATKLKEQQDGLVKVQNDLQITDNLLLSQIELLNNIKHVEIDKFNSIVTPIIKVNSFKLSDFNKQKKYYLYIPVKKIGDSDILILSSVPESSILSQFYLNNFVNNDKINYFKSDRNISQRIRLSNEGNISGNIFEQGTTILYIEITSLYEEINKTFDSTKTTSDKETDNINKEINNIVVDTLGFLPTIENVMRIICKDIDRWVSILGVTYNESINYISEYRSQFNNQLGITNDIQLYPFLDYINNNKKVIPNGGVFSTMPEVELVDEFIQAFIDNKNEKDKEPINTSTVTDLNGNNIWFPINPLDSTFVNGNNTSPYDNLGNGIDIIKTIFARYYVYNYYTQTSSKTGKQIFSNNANTFFINEYDNIINTINQPNILKQLKNIKLTQGKFKDNLKIFLTKNQIKEENIINILSKIGVNISEEFSGIQFTDNISTLNTNISKNNLLNKYLGKFIEPKNNYFTSEKLDLILDGGKYELKELNINDIGLTLNTENNIIFYDGRDDNITSFKSFDDGFSVFGFSIVSSSNNFTDIILSSINIKTIDIIPSGFTSDTLINKIIKNNYNINQLILEYYSDGDIFKKYYGYLNIIYVPDLKHIITVLVNKAIITEMPFLVKLYISSYIYAIENNFIDVDLNKFNEQDKSKFDENNKDFIFNVYTNNKILVSNNNKDLFNNHVNIRKDFINLLNNLTSKDKNKFIEFYEQTLNNSIFNNSFENFISVLKDKNIFKDYNIVSGNNLNNKNLLISSTDISNQSIITTLSQKTTVVVKSNYTFSNKEQFNIFSNFENQDLINKNIQDNINDEIFINPARKLFKKFEDRLTDKIKDLETNNQNTLRSPNRNTNSFQSIRTETYYSFKNFVDRWFSTNGSESVDPSRGFLLIDPDIPNNNIFSLFTFVNRFYDDSNAKNIIIDTTILGDFEEDLNVNMLTVIGRLLNHNGFEFYPLQNFIDYTDDRKTKLSWDDSDNTVIFKTFLGRERVFSGPRFTCMYIGGKSMYLDSGSNSNTSFKNDGFSSDVDMPDDSEATDNNKWFGFLVRFGDGKQSIFTSIELNTEEHQPTNESLSAMSQILDSGEVTPVPVYQNLFSTYEQRSYTCKIKMFGNVMIQPTQLFDLRNVPMFCGVYIILKVNHIIDGDTNTMVTEFEGVRLPKIPREFISNAYEVYGKNVTPSIGGGNSVSTSTNPRPESKLNKDDRKIYLVAGHNIVNQPGASSFIDDVQLREEMLNIELRDLIRDSLVNNKIDVEIDDNTKTLNQVVNDLKSKVNTNDIVVDIHFNSSSNTNNNPPGKGTEVFIKNGENSFIIDLAEKVVNTMSDILGINKRKSKFINLPTGVKLAKESYIEESALGSLIMFSIEANVILIEVCFINNRDEMRIYEQKKYELAEAIGKIIIEATVTETDKTFQGLETFDILNTLKYDNINNRNNPYLIENKEKLKSIIENNILKGDKYYIYNVPGIKPVRIGNRFENISKSTYLDLLFSQIELSAQKYEIDAMFITCIINAESRFNPAAVSETGALGITQFIRTSALIEVFRYLQTNKTVKTNVLALENNSFIQKNLTYEEILNIMLKDLTNVNINTDLATYLKQIQGGQLRVLENNIFNNPFIMIEFASIYFKILEKRDKTKNLGILSLSYNIGSVTHSYNENSSKPYYTNIIAKYNRAVETDNKRVINGLLRKDGGQGLPYPEKVIDFLLNLSIINKNDLIKTKINL